MHKSVLLAGLVLLVALVGISIKPPTASAISASDFQAGNIISTPVFTNQYTMSVQDIQNFLNSKVPTCDTNGTQPSSHSNGSGGFYTRAQWGAVYDAGNGTNIGAAPYVCLKDYVENPNTGQNNLQNPGASIPGGETAAQIIYVDSQIYQINPEVILVTLQKEQGLVTDDWPWVNEYTEAMGYNCSDSSGCSGFAGFYQQVDAAAKQFRNYLNNPTHFNYIAGQTQAIMYSPSCGGPTVYIQNSATAALYDYTPYQPNNNVLSHTNDTGSSSGPGASVSDSCAAYGNRNFWWYFNTWFPPGYSWSLDSFSYNATMAVGSTQTATLVVRNTGSQPWYNQNANPSAPIRLGTWGPSRSSPFQAGSWINAFRPANMTQNEVDPGNEATFTFQLTAPSTTGTYVEPFNLVFEGYQWMPWAGFSPTISVVNPYSWSVSSVNYSAGTGFMAPGTTQTITVTALNTGTATWTNTGTAPIHLGTWQPGRQSSVASGWIDSTRPANMTEASVPPGQTGTFTFNVHMPDSGQHYEALNLVAEGTTWFNNPGLTLYLQGEAYAWQPLWFSPSTGNWNMTRGTPFTLTVEAKNTGSATWYKDGNGPFPVHLATNGPENRGSALYTPSWLSNIRPAGLVQNSVPPGGEGTFSFNAVAPSAPGVRFEAFNLVAEGITWFNDPGFGFNINSL